YIYLIYYLYELKYIFDRKIDTWNWHRFSASTPRVGEAAGEDAESLTGVGFSQHLDVSDPFDPFKTAMTLGDQAEGKAMLVRERLLTHMCRQQCCTCFRKRQAPTIARHGDETHITCI